LTLERLSGLTLERILREIRRRTRVVGAFPYGQSALNLAAARLRHIAGTGWSTKRYLNIELLKDQQMRGRHENERPLPDSLPRFVTAFSISDESCTSAVMGRTFNFVADSMNGRQGRDLLAMASSRIGNRPVRSCTIFP
jgi:hypothetical protein